jgi:hypothetical protein
VHVASDVGGTFTMSGGTVYGKNEANETLKNTAATGAAVYNGGGNSKEDTVTSYP